MKYVFLVHRDERQWDAMPASERRALEKVCLASEQDLRQSGHLFAIASPNGNHTTITVRVVNGKVFLDDRPFVETKSQHISLFFIEARDLNEAIQVASRMPQARRDPIEVRPIMEFDPGAFHGQS